MIMNHTHLAGWLRIYGKSHYPHHNVCTLSLKAPVVHDMMHGMLSASDTWCH